MPHFFHTDYRRVVLHKSGMEKRSVTFSTPRRCFAVLPRFQRQALRLKAYLRRPQLRVPSCPARAQVLQFPVLRFDSSEAVARAAVPVHVARLRLHLYVCLGARIGGRQILLSPFRNSHDPGVRTISTSFPGDPSCRARRDISVKELRKARHPSRVSIGPLKSGLQEC